MMSSEGSIGIKALRKMRHYHSVLGLSGVVAFVRSKLSGTRPLFKTKLPGIRYPFYLRIGTTDASVCKQVLMERHYDCALSITPKVIVDAGANIGLSAVFFANKYPDSIIFALEPEESNFQVLERNVSPYPHIKPLKVALWNRCGRICLIDSGAGNDGYQTVEAATDNSEKRRFVEAMTLDALMNEVGLTSIDILKIDIEGAEKDVFECSEVWIEKVRVIMAELHDNIKAGCRNSFSVATKGFDMEFTKGEIVMCLRR